MLIYKINSIEDIVFIISLLQHILKQLLKEKQDLQGPKGKEDRMDFKEIEENV